MTEAYEAWVQHIRECRACEEGEPDYGWQRIRGLTNDPPHAMFGA